MLISPVNFADMVSLSPSAFDLVCSYAKSKSKAKVDTTKIPVFELLSDSLRSELRLELALPHMRVHPQLAISVALVDAWYCGSLRKVV